MGRPPLPDKEKEAVRRIFDSYCKKVLRGTAINYDKKRNYVAEHETSMSDLPENIHALLQADNQFQQNYFFEVSGEIIIVKGDDIARAISALPAVQREIILLSYFTDKTDTEISLKLDIARSTVQSKRTAALKKLKEILEERET